jgi:hypothetical protein
VLRRGAGRYAVQSAVGMNVILAGRPGVVLLIDTASPHQVIRLPSTLPAGTARTTRVLAVSWR